MNIGDLFFRAQIDDSRLALDAKRAGDKAGSAAGYSFGRKLGTELKAGFGIGAGFTAFNLIGQGISSVTDFMGDAIESASNLSESLSKSNVVFGDNAAAVESWAEDSAQAFGQSKQQALEAASTYGNLFQAFGETADNSAVMSKRLVELAADLASFNNTSVDDAILALRSGLSGETEPLKRYGIAINDARMRQTLMAEGVKDLGATLTPLQKAQAAYTLILKDSTLAQGDFARTSDGLANQQRIVAAELENVKAEVGEGLLPVQLQWEKGNLDLIRSLRGISDVTKGGEVPRGQLIDDMQSLLRTVPGLGGLFGDFGADLIGEQEAALDAADATKELSGELVRQMGIAKNARDPLDGLSESTDDLHDNAKTAAPAIDRMRSELRDLGYDADEAEQAIDDLASTISDELFGDAITAGNEARLKEQIKDLREQRAEVKKGSPEWTELTGEIAEAQAALFDLHLEQAKKAGPQAVIAFLEQERKKLRQSDSAARAYIDSLIRLYGTMVRYSDLGVISFGRYTGKIIPRAGGGPVDMGRTYLVGEEGPELFVPDSAGAIVPNPDLSPMSYSAVPTATNSWASSITINGLSIDARGSANPSATGTAVRQGVHDAMADVLRQQNARLPTGSRS